MYNYIEKEIEDMIENNAHRYRCPADTPLEEVLSPESVGLIRRLGVWSEKLIKDIYILQMKLQIWILIQIAERSGVNYMMR